MVKINKIEIELPFNMEVSATLLNEIDKALTKHLCKLYEQEHPDRVMWTSGYGAKMIFSKNDALFLGKREWDDSIKKGDEPKIDTSIYVMEITERERYKGE